MRLEAGSEGGSGAPREVYGVWCQDILRGRRSFASCLSLHHTRVVSWLSQKGLDKP